MFALWALVAYLASYLVAHVSPVLCERRLTRFTRCKGFVLLWFCLVVLRFACVLFLLGLVWFPYSAFASLHAFIPSLTGAQRTDSSPASKKNSSSSQLVMEVLKQQPES